MGVCIKNGLLVDPANGICSKADLMVEDGKIAGVGHASMQAEEIIDAEGLVVCPGFVDMHMHEDPVGSDGRIQPDIFCCMLRMGVTTCVGGNCGINIYDPTTYLDIVDRDGAPVNVGLFAGHGSSRERAGALDKYRAITSEQKKSMMESLRNGLQAGCVGVSFGLRYVPGTDEQELLAAAALCGSVGKPVSAHVRDDAEGVFAAVEEMAKAGEKCRVPVQISHIGSMGGFGQMERLLRMVETYRANGLDIGCDCYPYSAFSTRIGETTYDDGWLKRYNCDYDVCQLSEGKYKGQRCTAETFAEMRRSFPSCLTVCHVMREEDVRMAIRHPYVLTASDGILDKGQGHPRAAGTFPRIFAEFVRKGELTLVDAVAKMTCLPADRLRLAGKGRLNVGADADITIFDIHTIADCATFEEPTLAPMGIEYVLIGGKTAVRKGQIVRNDLGKAIRV